MAYATLTDLINFMGVSQDALPTNVQTLLNRANDIIEGKISRNYNPKREKHVNAAKNAVCAQTQFWIDNNVSPSSDGSVTGYSLGDLSMSYDANSRKAASSICPLAKDYLNDAYLLYLGLR